MSFLHLVVVAVLQGVTEFLPISSSGHLILVPALTGWPDQGLSMDIAVHVGTLGAVTVYVWRDIADMAGGVWQVVFKRKRHPGARLFVILLLATVPVVIAGFLLKEVIATSFRSATLIAWTTLVFGLLLYAVDRASLTVRRLDHMTVLGGLFIGVAQVLALVPGTSRAGITITAARVMGFERRDAARFSMLLSIPTILGAGVLSGRELYDRGELTLGSDAVVAAGLAFVTALVAILLMMAWLRRASYAPFVVYRVLLGLVLLAWVYGFLAEPLGIPAPG